MSRFSLGIIETLGLATAIEVADVCVKSANVELIGYEFTKGSGMTVVKIEGDVGAVKAAVDAATSIDKVLFSKVIARPNREIEMLVRNKETIGLKSVEDRMEDKSEEEDIVKDLKEIETIKETEEEMELIKDNVKKTFKNSDDQLAINQKKYSCNICKDSKCTRKKGELVSTCIHYKKNKIKED
ncbi:BMC domain-containing protein [Tissierella sp. MSJ-40]|uniref:BMC domain-containing protein n=1 Tax=Tissierella simiarum TaxID=2841534 RepID=A0ABS6E3P9_9FIRM|nr:BMC domain-containing protein [Tissierella simiarum]MBU5437534.1 BMC domain-containing protein [Tissierella simiarum]